jgi:hypothetical protein
VTVTSHQVVGPYETVQLHPNSTSDTAALTSWLAVNGYNVPSNVEPLIAAYVFEGSDFLALRLVPGQGVQAMRPVSVTTPGAGLTLPLRMVAAGTGAKVGITLWVVATGRYEPQNFAHFVISSTDLLWDWSASSSNYNSLRAQKEAGFYNAAWQIESSLDVSPNVIENVVLQDPTASAYAPPPPPDGGGTSQDSGDAGGVTPAEARSQDLSTLFPTHGASVRITRMRADLSQAALANDLVLEASSDQTPLSNTYQTTKSVNDKAACPACPCGFLGCTTSAPISSGGGPLATFAALLALGTASMLARRAVRARLLRAI